MKKILGSFISFLCVVITMTSCDDYNTFTTSPQARLEFSRDTVAFDTIVTGASSFTHTLIVHNRNNDGVRVKDVHLGQGKNSLFRINVDGEYLPTGQGSDFEIRKRDSLFVRLEVELPYEDDDAIKHYKDYLQFTLESGVTQRVVLTADGLNGIILNGLDVDHDMTLDATSPYFVRDSLIIRQGARLTIEPGVRLLFHDKVEMHIYGQLNAVGTQEKPIIFRGDRIDNLLEGIPYDNMPNRWGGIVFHGSSRDNVMEQCDVHSGDFGIVCDSTLGQWDENHPTLRMTNSVIHNVGGDALRMTSCVTQIMGTQISNAKGRCVSILGGCHDFVHCTVAQFYPFTAGRGDALFMANVIDDNADLFYYLHRCHFLNCVITGYGDDVIMGSIQDYQDAECDYLFDHCLLRTPEVKDSDRFRNNIYDVKDLEPQSQDHFLLLDTDHFYYDFAPDSLSAIHNLADPEWMKLNPIDRRGNTRINCAGAYEGK